MKKYIYTIFLFITTTVSFAQEKREFKEGIFIEIANFYPSDHDLFRPEIVKQSYKDETSFVYDYSMNNLFSMSISDVNKGLKKEIGGGRGSGPDEFRNPTDKCVSMVAGKERIFVADASLARISVWDGVSGNLISSFKTKRFIPYRITCTDNEVIAYNKAGNNAGNFLVYNLDGKLINGIHDETLSKDGFFDSGDITADEEFIYFASEGKTELRKYNYQKNDIVYAKDTIVKLEGENKLERKSTGSEEVLTKRSAEFKYQSRGIGIFNDYLLVLYSGRKDAHGKIIDFYNKKDLSYQFSINLEHLFSKMSEYNGKILLNAYDFEREERRFYVFKLNMK